MILLYVTKKSGIRETKHLSTDADSSTDAIGGQKGKISDTPFDQRSLIHWEAWTKNTQKPNFFRKTENIIQNAKTQKRLEICQN